MKKTLFAIIICLLIFIIPVSALAEDGTWEAVGTAGFSDAGAWESSLYVYNGIPYIAYKDSANSNKITVKKYDSTWQTVGTEGISGPNSQNVSLFVYDGFVYVAYRDGGSSYKLSVKKFDGANWVTLGTEGFSDADVSHVSLYIYNDIPYVAYMDYGGSNSMKATVKMFDGTNWVTVGKERFSTDKAYYVSLYISNGTPYAAYSNSGSNGQATVSKFNGSSWEAVGGENIVTVTRYLSLYVNNNTPYLAYPDSSNGSRMTVKTFNGSSWEMLGSSLSAGSSTYPKISVSNDTIYLGYSDITLGSKAVVKKYSDTGWETVGTEGFSAGKIYYLSLFVDNGIPYAGYTDAMHKYKATVMKFVPANTPPCLISGSTGCDRIHVNNEYSLKLSDIFKDADGDTLEYKVSINGAPYIIADENYSFTPNTLGDTVFVFTASDGIDISADSYTFTLTADNTIPNRINTVPETDTANTLVNAPYELDLSLIFEDADNDDLTYQVSVDGSSFVSANEIYSYTPTAAGDIQLVFQALDAMSTSDDTYSVTLTAINGNHTITYNANGGVGSGSEIHIATSMFDLNNGLDFIMNNYIIDGWTIDGIDYALAQLYTMPNLDVTAYAIWVADSDNDGVSDDDEIFAGTDPNNTFDTPRKGRITVTIYDHNDIPISNIKCVLNSTPVQLTTDSNGYVSFDNVLLTRHNLSVRDDFSQLSTYYLSFINTGINMATIQDNAERDNDGAISTAISQSFMSLDIIIRLSAANFWILDSASITSIEINDENYKYLFTNPDTGDNSCE